ncbi:hypothetical protein V2H45_13670 [Tumidithrix elongata RA019]|uniref:GNAT family acetyltransferase n=1 Tax=Tumidithrix elongata BACA0141 TaxID=2716417 RepID=A0AAW9PTA4_9CYAN|nr:hypothetical protein [Tumidithrix elongata RA019]
MIATRIAVTSDIDGILDLQSVNLYTNLSDAERLEGFVTTPFTPDQIRSLIAQTGVFVAEQEGKIDGYIFAGSWQFFSQWEIFPFMVSRFPNLSFQGKQITVENTFQYGPICIDRRLRGSGVFLQLFETMRSNFSTRFPMGVTFINRLNQRSFEAHTRKLNLEAIDRFDFNHHSFYSLAFLTKDYNEQD